MYKVCLIKKVGSSTPLISCSPANLSFCSDPCWPPVRLPPRTSLAPVQEGRAGVSEHGVRASRTATSTPAGIWLLHLAAAFSTVHSAPGHSAALGSRERLDRPGGCGAKVDRAFQVPSTEPCQVSEFS